MATPKLNANDDGSWSASANSLLETVAFVGALNATIEFLEATPEEIAAWVARRPLHSDDEEGDAE